eukprot:CAMPEP_0171172896 /NCGR_PEP_ID=MMETSP0790-20130122/9949_1 /TAXON_ID=2925 /ORGANISM="Alexandrium catenella, Strain OF101" /LENGTH=356 /DNA_ID=CAMNT_0011637755 /DNA_START=59 /DNA_END=1125 /DNA_ORIENTATION=-
MARSQALLPLLVGAVLCLAFAGRAFTQPASPPRAGHVLRPSTLPGKSAAQTGETLSGSALPAVGLALLAAAVGGRAAGSVACRAAAVKKKGVRVVGGKEIPWNLFSPKAPYKGTCITNDTITSKTRLCNWETTHVVMRHDKKVPYLEGQSIGIIAPGPDKKGEAPAKIRLYSIASSAPGDDETYETVSLCVKRVVEVDGMNWCKYSNVEPGTDPEYPDAKMVYRGVCSSHICDLKPGQEVLITGPVGAEMLLPEEDDANIVMFATGTGIAPFRSFLRRLFHDKGTKGKFAGIAWLFMGVPFSQSLLYDEEWAEMMKENPDAFRYDYAISNEQKCEKNKINGEMWVQHRAMDYAEEL